MHPDYRALIERRFHVPLPEAGTDKRLPLAEAIARFTRPGMKVHFASTHTRPYGLGYALARHYWKKDARIEASLLNVGETWIALVLGGVLSKAVTTFSGDIWPYPSPNPVMNRYWLEKKIDIEHWSILSFTQRLLAGALGVPFAPTRSVVGSTMAEDNEKRGTYKEIDDPFHPGEKVGLVAPLHPDITFLHVPACDVSGNAIITAPLGEGPLSCFAAREGVILSTEKIVPTSYLREHNHLVKVPAHLVKAVVELPYGGHPRGVTNVGAPDLPQYADDYAFLFEVRKAARASEEALEKWIKEWILSCKSQEEFIHKLGHQRLEKIRRRAEPQSWHSDLEAVARGETSDAGEPAKLSPDVSQFIGSEMMICAASRKMAAISKELELSHILAGVGAANLSAWLCLHHLRAEGRSIETMAEIGYFGYEPRPSDPYIFNFRNTPTCVSTTDILTVLGMLVPDGRNLGSLGAAQVDRYGNVNSTCIPGKMHFMGSGGGNDVASGAKAVCVTAYLGKDKFKEKVDYVTSPGKNVRLVVTDRGVFEKEPGASELVLTGYYTHGPTAYKNAEEAVREIKGLVGWDLKVRDKLDAIGAPTKEELELLRIYDPYGQFLR